ncbi:hypothetical protein [Candidatus Protochlamydia phocaeensis]|uniref:hypothetical protein n=1 Tax=Candidatus Protochlamydia phocaeensis TaxID=1414722 RepID=UPI00083854C4|nr:hypothetical protein [Candidatus Protochlamydia phocaeensis]
MSFNYSVKSTNDAPGKPQEKALDSKPKKASNLFGRKVSVSNPKKEKEKDSHSNSTPQLPIPTTPPSSATDEKLMQELKQKLEEQREQRDESLPLTSPRRRANSGAKEIPPLRDRDVITHPETEKRKSVNFPPTPRSSVHFSLTPPSLTKDKSIIHSPPKFTPSSDSKTRSMKEIAVDLSNLSHLLLLAAEQAEMENMAYYETQQDSQAHTPVAMQERAHQLVFDQLGRKFNETFQLAAREADVAFRKGEARPRSFTFRNFDMTDMRASPSSSEKTLPFAEAFKKDSSHSKNKTALQIGIEAYRYLILNPKEEITSESNAVKAGQFDSKPSVYHYIQDLKKLAELLNRVCKESLKKEDKSDQYNRFVTAFIKQLKQAKDIRDIRNENQQKELIVQRCHELSALVLVHVEEIQTEYAQIYHNKIKSSLKHCVFNIEDNLLFKTFTTFGADFTRALYGGFLKLSSQKFEKEVASINFSNTRKDPKAVPNMPTAIFYRHLVDMLKLWMQDLNISLKTPQAKDIFKQIKMDIETGESTLEAEASKEDVLYLFGELFSSLDVKFSSAMLEAVTKNPKEIDITDRLMQMQMHKDIATGIMNDPSTAYLKLIPLFRAFSQSILLEIQARTFILHRSWINGSSSDKLVREVNDRNDWENKQIHIAFAHNKVIITINRLGHLEDHPSCLLQSQLVLTADIDNFGNWTVEPCMIIEKPTSSNLEFEQKYHELMFTLQSMGIPHKEEKIHI